MKTRLTNLITQYSVGGIVLESAWTIKDKKLFVKFQSESETILGLAQLDDFDANDNQFGVSNSQQLLSGLKPLDDDATITVEYDRMRIKFKDSSGAENIRTLSNIDILAIENPNPENSFNFKRDQFDFEIELNDEFYSKLNKIRNIESNNLAFRAITNTSGEVIVNYSTNNENTGKFPIKLKLGTPMSSPILFDTDNFIKILLANKHMDSKSLLISNELGLAQLKFKSKGLNIMYYLIHLA